MLTTGIQGSLPIVMAVFNSTHIRQGVVPPDFHTSGRVGGLLYKLKAGNETNDGPAIYTPAIGKSFIQASDVCRGQIKESMVSGGRLTINE